MGDHHIRGQTLELRVADPGLRPLLQRRLRDVDGALRQAVDAVLDALDHPQRELRLGRVELDLGELPLERLEQGLTDALPDALRAALAPRIAALAPRSPPRAADGDALAGSRTLGGDRLVEREVGAREALIHYLRFGRRTWWSSRVDWSSLMADAAAGLRDVAALRQLWAQLEPPDPLAALQRLAGDGGWAAVEPAVRAALGVDTLAEYESLAQGLDDVPALGRLLALFRLLDGSKRIAPRRLGAHLRDQVQGARVRAWLQAQADAGSAQDPAAHHLRELLEGAGPRPAAPSMGPAATAAAFGTAAEPAEVATPVESLREHADRLVSRQGDAAGSAEAMATPSAGLVLLHPFLEQLFRSRDLLDEDGGWRPGGQRRAVGLLAGLGWADQVPVDPELGLEKLLCGLDPDAPCWPLAPGSDDLDAAAALLDAVIRHWGALGSTSADGLREGFVQRPGRLYREPDGWRLRVELRAWDLLLDRLPWPLGVVRLPWMAQPLMVSWR